MLCAPPAPVSPRPPRPISSSVLSMKFQREMFRQRNHCSLRGFALLRQQSADRHRAPTGPRRQTRRLRGGGVVGGGSSGSQTRRGAKTKVLLNNVKLRLFDESSRCRCQPHPSVRSTTTFLIGTPATTPTRPPSPPHGSKFHPPSGHRYGRQLPLPQLGVSKTSGAEKMR